jgi:hypothetical protein
MDRTELRKERNENVTIRIERNDDWIPTPGSEDPAGESSFIEARRHTAK